jgi:hypothetical protein
VSTATNRRPIRVLNLIGPGDVVAAFNDWKGSVRTVSETSITTTSQTFEFLLCPAPAPAPTAGGPR